MQYTTHHGRSIKGNEQGFASLAIALVLILVLALLSVSFAQLSRREQQSALTKQLSSQAYYAAESGINDAYSDIKNNVISDTNNLAKASRTSCMNVTDPAAKTKNSNAVIDSGSGLSYNCLLVDLAPPVLAWTKVGSQSSRNIVFSSGSTSTLKQFTVAWSSGDGQNAPIPPAQSGKFTTQAAWNAAKHPALVEISLTPLTDSTRDSFVNNTFHTYLYPTATTSTSTGDFTFDTSNAGQGLITNANCSAAGLCGATISGLPTSGGSNIKYLLHFTTYYDNVTDINLQHAFDAANNSTDFAGGQAQIDVTGKAKDVSKRLLVRLPLINLADTLSTYPVEVSNICKHVETKPTTADDPVGSLYMQLANPDAQAVSGGACDLTQ